MKGSVLARGGVGLAGVVLGCFGVMGGGATAVSCASSVPQDERTPVDERVNDVAPPKPTPAQPTQTTPPKPAEPPPAPVQTAQTPPQPTAPVQPPAPPKPAQTTPPPPPAPALPTPAQAAPVVQQGVTGASCSIKGTYAIPKGTPITDGNGRMIATFTGNNAPATISDLVADTQNGKVRVVTTTGTGAVRIEGYAPASAFTTFTTRDVPVMAGHVWISSAYKVKIVGATASSVTVELAVAGSKGQTVRGTTTCDALALQRGTPVPYQVPGNGRGYLTKEAAINLYDRANGDIIFSLNMLEGSSHLFWSTEMKGGFVHVQSRADLTIDAWARYGDLDPLKKGEMIDQYIPPQTGIGGAQIVMEKPPRVAVATKEIGIRAKRDDKEKAIGFVEPGAEIYVMETVAGWTNVLPKSLYVLPHDAAEFGFWVPTSEVPK